MSDNTAQRDYWNSPVAANWIARAEHFERGFSEITSVLMAFAAPAPDMYVLDIGCGIAPLAGVWLVGAKA